MILPSPRLPFVQIVRLQKQVDILLTILRHWCQPIRKTFRVTLVNRQCDSVPIKWYCVFALRPNFRLHLLASFVSSL